MKKIVLNIPDDKYFAVIRYIKSKFSDIHIEEKESMRGKYKVEEEDNTTETLLLSEKSLAEDWLSDDDSRWDELF
jgi:hypothetical protein